VRGLRRSEHGAAIEQDVRALTTTRRGALLEVLLSLPRAVGDPNLHAGIGVRELQRSGVSAARLGLELRLVFALEHDVLTLARVADHDEICRYLENL